MPHDIDERRKFAAVLVIAVHIVGNGDKMNSMLTKKHLGINAGLQIITSGPGKVFDQHSPDHSGLNIGDHLFPCRPLKVTARPAVIRIMAAVGQPVRSSIILKVFFLRCDLSRVFSPKSIYW